MDPLPARAFTGPPTLIEAVYPMPPPGKKRSCFDQSRKLFFTLRKDPAMLEHLRFVGFEQPFGFGAHFVVEDDRSVFDQTSRVEGHPDWTRLTKASYWGFFSNAKHIVKFDNDQFQILYDILCTFQDDKHTPSCKRILAIMIVIKGLWEKGAAKETEGERFQRILEKILNKKQG